MGSLLSTATSLLGGGNNNANFVANPATVTAGTNTGQIDNSYGQNQEALNQQKALAQALLAQTPGAQTAQNGVLTALTGIANGTGANPALNTLTQGTNAAVQNAGALAGGVRGASSNPGLVARQIAQTAAGAGQTNAATAATTEATQQLNALNGLGTEANNIVGQGQTGVNADTSATQGEQSALQSALTNQNNANVSAVSNANNANAGLASTNANNSAKAVGGLVNSAGGVVGLAKGGMVVPEHLKHVASIYHPQMLSTGGAIDGSAYAEAGRPVPGKAVVAGDSKKNDKIPALLSPEEAVLPRSIMLADDAPERAAEFVRKLKEKYGDQEDDQSDFKNALKKAISNRRSK